MAWERMQPWLKIQRTNDNKAFPLFHVTTTEANILKEKFKQVLTYLKKNYSKRFTPNRLSSFFRQHLADQCGDFTEASLCLSELPVAGQQTPLYYYTPALTTLQEEYAKACSNLEESLLTHHDKDYVHAPKPILLKSKDEQIHGGSSICPLDEYVTEIVNELKERVIRARVSQSPLLSFVNCHNTFTSYCLAFLSFASGYRAIDNPPSLSFRYRF